MKEQVAAIPPEWFVAAAEAGEFWTAERCFITEIVNDDKVPEVSGVEEIYVVRSGRGSIEIDGVEQALGPGDQAIVPRSAAQRMTNTGQDDLSCYCLCRPRFRPECYIDLEAETA